MLPVVFCHCAVCPPVWWAWVTSNRDKSGRTCLEIIFYGKTSKKCSTDTPHMFFVLFFTEEQSSTLHNEVSSRNEGDGGGKEGVAEHGEKEKKLLLDIFKI